jgi:DNA-binding GntR family transcriptional regulator
MEQARQIIRRLILNGTYRPGERIKEAEVAKALKISRSPVREAVMNLASEGLIELHPQRGAFVRALEAGEVRDLFEVREALEVRAVRLAARRVELADLEPLLGLLKETERALGEDDGIYPSDLDFHVGLAKLSGNESLAAYVSRVSSQLRLARVRSSAEPGRANRAYGEHLAVVEAVAAGDPEKAESALKFHLRNALRSTVGGTGEQGAVVA